MKRNLIGILSLVALALLLNATAVYAQSDVKANVPFAFKVGNAQLPAGTYEFRTADENAVMIHNSKTSAGALTLAQREYPSNASPRLIFHRVGNQYFLAEIWGAAGNDGMRLPASKLEKESQIASGPANTEEVVIAMVR